MRPEKHCNTCKQKKGGQRRSTAVNKDFYCREVRGFLSSNKISLLLAVVREIQKCVKAPDESTKNSAPVYARLFLDFHKNSTQARYTTEYVATVVQTCYRKITGETSDRRSSPVSCLPAPVT